MLRRFRRDERGVTAIEFGVIALPFFALIFAIIEVGMVFFAAQTMETAVEMAARLVRTGEAHQREMTKDDFLGEICGVLEGLFDCRNGLRLDVRTYPAFGSIDLSVPFDAQGNLDTKDFTYDMGKGGDIVVVRAFYEWPVLINLMGLDLANMPAGTRLLGTTTAFRNEPFTW